MPNPSLGPVNHSTRVQRSQNENLILNPRGPQSEIRIRKIRNVDLSVAIFRQWAFPIVIKKRTEELESRSPTVNAL
jgi:hypothetical protein